MSDNKSGNKLYFDIETTGLSAASSHITVIGTAFCDAEGTHVKQFVCRKPTDEKKILKKFASYITGFDSLVHFNGRSFDIPYVSAKLRFYSIRNTLYDMHETDLYRSAKHFSFLTGLTKSKQKDIENYFGIRRTDTLSGSDCVKAYMDYICSGDKEALDKLLLHNKEDLEGMVQIQEHLAALLAVARGEFTVSGLSGNEDELSRNESGLSGSESDPAGVLHIKLDLTTAFRSSIRASFEPSAEKEGIPFSFEGTDKTGIFSINSFSGDLKYFFDDYKDYYYLPAEGRAVHRSVGQFVDPAFREKAKKETAFEPVTGVFYPQCRSVIRPEFKKKPDDQNAWFRLEDVKSPEDLKKLIIAAFDAAGS